MLDLTPPLGKQVLAVSLVLQRAPVAAQADVMADTAARGQHNALAQRAQLEAQVEVFTAVDETLVKPALGMCGSNSDSHFKMSFLWFYECVLSFFQVAMASRNSSTRDKVLHASWFD